VSAPARDRCASRAVGRLQAQPSIFSPVAFSASGRALVAHVHEAACGPDRIALFLHSTPDAVGFYEHIGMRREATFFSRNNFS